jgi:hypothetical protein
MARRLRPIKIEQIERRPCGRPVYNLAVVDDESYVAEDVIVHNCRAVLVPVPIDVQVPESEFITAGQIGRAKDLIQEGFR